MRKFLGQSIEVGSGESVLNDLILLRSEGLDEVNCKTFETTHPYWRGEKISNTYRFQGAICLVLEFDPRCHSFIQLDFLQLNSWEENGSQGVSRYSTKRETMGSAYKIHGTPYAKPFVMKGCNLRIDFNPPI